MTDHRARSGPHAAGATYVDHGLRRQGVDPGQVQPDHAVAGEPASLALALVRA